MLHKNYLLKQFPKLLLALLLASAAGCRESDEQPEPSTQRTFAARQPEDGNPGIKYTDPDARYEYKTGTPGNFQYHYNVKGRDEDGLSVTGAIDIQGKYGGGLLYDDAGNAVEVEVQWIDYSVLEATDNVGKVYALKVK